jgi:lysophospholipid acyltransferase (LPLAT)-like uncharacterized protein
MDRSKFRDKAINGLVTLAYLFIKTWFGTCRIKILNEEFHQEVLKGTGAYIGATWHRATIFFCYFYGPQHPMTMISQSQDGEFLARFAEKCGMIPVRGSSTRGGGRALLRMIRHLKQGNKFCTTVLDGPQGPPYIAKKGLLLLAQKSGVPLVPVIWSGRRTFTFEKSWDKTMIPWPFSRVVVAYGPPFFIPKDSSDLDLEDLRLEFQGRLNALLEQVDGITGYKTRQFKPVQHRS